MARPDKLIRVLTEAETSSLLSQPNPPTGHVPIDSYLGRPTLWDGQPALGTWQGSYFNEHRDNGGRG